jgi:hypothetical protein
VTERRFNVKYNFARRPSRKSGYYCSWREGQRFRPKPSARVAHHGADPLETSRESWIGPSNFDSAWPAAPVSASATGGYLLICITYPPWQIKAHWQLAGNPRVGIGHTKGFRMAMVARIDKRGAGCTALLLFNFLSCSSVPSASPPDPSR